MKHKYISTGGLGDAFISFLKLRQIWRAQDDRQIDWLHVESTDKIEIPFREIFNWICDNGIIPSFEYDPNYIQNYQNGKWKDRISVSSGIDSFCPLKGETSIVLREPYLDSILDRVLEKKVYDVVFQCSAGAKNNRGWEFDVRKVADLYRRTRNKKVAIVGNDPRLEDKFDADNFVGKLDIVETCDIIKHSRLFVGLSGFLNYYACAKRVPNIHVSESKEHDLRYFHPKWEEYAISIKDARMAGVIYAVNGEIMRESRRRSDVVLMQMTMAAGRLIDGSPIRSTLPLHKEYFKKIIIVDGALDDEARSFYTPFENLGLKVIDSPWQDSYINQYRKAVAELEEGETGLWLDCDEAISTELGEFLLKYNSNEQPSMTKLPCVLHLTDDGGKTYHAAEAAPPKKMNKTTWTKNILFKKTKNLDFHVNGSHVIPHHKGLETEQYIPYPYYHMKSLESFVQNDVYQAFLAPSGQGYTGEESVLFKMLTSCYRSTKEFKQATKKGSWSAPLKKFAWDKRHESHRPISRLAWLYFILEGHVMPEKDDSMEWSNVKKYVLSKETMAIFEENKKRK